MAMIRQIRYGALEREIFYAIYTYYFDNPKIIQSYEEDAFKLTKERFHKEEM